MRTWAFFGLVILGITSCSAPIKQFYPDSYFEEDRIYQNKPLRFSLVFQGNWNIYTDPNIMMRSLKNLAIDHQKEGRELLFVGTTVDGLQGVKGIAINLNASPQEYAETYRKIKTTDNSNMTADSGLVDILINNKPMVRWCYTEFNCEFIEFFFTIDTYNVRISFWAKSTIFKRFLPVYFSIISSLDFISRY